MAKRKLDLKLAKAFIDKARELHEVEGEVEVDDTPETFKDSKAMLSTSSESVDHIKENGGVYVKAWVWVPFTEVES